MHTRLSKMLRGCTAPAQAAGVKAECCCIPALHVCTFESCSAFISLGPSKPLPPVLHTRSSDTLALFYAAFSPLSYNIPLSCALQPGQGRSSPRSRAGRGWGSLSTPLVIALSYHPSSFAFVAQPQRNCSNHLFGEMIINLLPPSQRAGAAHGRCKNFTPCTQVGAHSSDLKKKQKKNTGHFMDISIQRPSRIWSHWEAHARKIHILIKL